jgi:hypothetical protein
MATAATRLKWATTVGAQWTAGQRRNRDGNSHEQQWWLWEKGMAAARFQWATAKAAQWTVGWWWGDCNGNGQRQREGNTMEEGDDSSTIAQAMVGAAQQMALGNVQGQ